MHRIDLTAFASRGLTPHSTGRLTAPVNSNVSRHLHSNKNKRKMEWFFEILFEIFGEFSLQFIFEALAQAGIHFIRNPDRDLRDQSPWVLVVGYAILGAACGGISLLLFPHYFLRSHFVRVAYLVLAPAATSLAIAAIGILRSRNGQARAGLDRLGYGYVFAFSFAVIRFGFASYAA